MTLDPTLLQNFAIALFIGALIGIEREKRKEQPGERGAGDPPNAGIGGLRTFILFAEAGALAAWMAVTLEAPFVFVGIGALVCAVIVAGYFMQARANPGSVGLTTEVAAVVTYLLGGAVIFGHPEIAVALAITTSALLAYKQPLHGVVGKLGTEDLYAGLKLLIATFIVLPLLPDETVDPWGALNPYKLWWLVILISSLSLVGYVAVRWLGKERGTSLTGVFGGLVSSTAVTLSFAKRSREEPALSDTLAAGVLLAWTVMFARVIVEVAVVHARLVGPIAVTMSAMGVLTLVIALLQYRAGAAAGAKKGGALREDVPVRNPFSLTSAVKFGAFFAVVLLAVKLVERHASGAGFYAVAAIAGLTDVDAIALSMANYARQGGDADVAVTAITIAAVSNTLAKCAMIAALGAAGLKRRLAIATALILAAGVVATLGYRGGFS